MDSTLNELADVKIEGFPTIKLFPAGTGAPIDFEGSRDLEGFAAFLKEHTGIEVAVPAEEHGATEQEHDHDEL